MTATALLPAVLGPDVLARHAAELAGELRPATPLERVLVREIARHGAALERVELAELATLRCGAADAGAIVRAGLGGGAVADDQIALAAAVGTDAVDRVTRYRRAHERGLYDALRRLDEVRAGRRRSNANGPGPEGGTPFPSDQACAAYLAGWARRQPFRCPRCGRDAARWLAARQRLKCRACGYQVGPRHGTVMARSGLPLLAWFGAIQALLARPDASSAEVAARANISRRKTARRMARQVRAALASPDATRLLAGLDEVFAGGVRPRPPGAPGAPGRGDFAKRTGRRSGRHDGAQGQTHQHVPVTAGSAGPPRRGAPSAPGGPGAQEKRTPCRGPACRLGLAPETAPVFATMRI